VDQIRYGLVSVSREKALRKVKSGIVVYEVIVVKLLINLSEYH